MVVWLKQSTTFVVQAIPQAGQADPEVIFNRQWVAEKISDNIGSLIEIGLSVRGIVTNNHSANFNAFSAWRHIQFRIKLFYRASAKQHLALHPGNKKQNIPLALETTITATGSYFPNCGDAVNFLESFNTWWTILNSKQRFSPNILINVVINGTENWVFRCSGRLN